VAVGVEEVLGICGCGKVLAEVCPVFEGHHEWFSRGVLRTGFILLKWGGWSHCGGAPLLGAPILVGLNALWWD
jgi:hypothetical protein